MHGIGMLRIQMNNCCNKLFKHALQSRLISLTENVADLTTVVSATPCEIERNLFVGYPELHFIEEVVILKTHLHRCALDDDFLFIELEQFIMNTREYVGDQNGYTYFVS